ESGTTQSNTVASRRGNSRGLSGCGRRHHRNKYLSGTTIGLHDFLFQGEPTRGRKDQEFFQRVLDNVDLRALVHEINFDAAKIALHVADRFANETGRRRFVGGSMGPLPVAGSISPDVNDPAFRAVSFDQLRQTYFDQAEALLEGGVDLLIIE